MKTKREDSVGTRQPARPAELPDRRRPARGVHVDLGQPSLVFVTVCTKDRKRWLACDEAHRLLVDVWRRSEAWLVGNYVLMPDHLHLFAAMSWFGGAPGQNGSAGGGSEQRGSAGASPYLENEVVAGGRAKDGRATLLRSRPPAEGGLEQRGSAGASPYRGRGRDQNPSQGQQPYITIEKWITFWKSQFSKCHAHPDWSWQTSAFHHRLRQGESYSQKWHYVRENPVRAGLAKEVGRWPYQGVIHELRW